MNEILAVTFKFAVDVGIKATILFSLTALAVLALRRSGAAARHFVGTAGLAGALALPLLTLALPSLVCPRLRSPASSVKPSTPRTQPSAGVSEASLEKESAPASLSESAVEPVKASVSAPPVPAPSKEVPWLPIALAA